MNLTDYDWIVLNSSAGKDSQAMTDYVCRMAIEQGVLDKVRMFPDDLEGECEQCKHAIFYRPEPPFLIKFLCIDCAMPLLKPDAEYVCSSKTIKEVALIVAALKMRERKDPNPSKPGG